MTTRVSVFGLGNVGQALLRSFARIRGGAELVLATDGRGVFLGEGLDPAQVIKRKLARDYDRPRAEGDAAALLALAKPDVHVELTPTDLEAGQPADADVRAALEQRVPVVTATKSHQRTREALSGILDLAQARGVPFLDHAATLAGIPATEMVAGIGMELVEIEGVLNGTTNYMLKRLAEGAAFDSARDEAVEKGFAERNWRYDLEGNDVAVKLVGLIRHLTEEKVLKLFGQVRLEGGQLQAAVGPRVVSRDDPFAGIEGFQNAVRLRGVMNDSKMELFLCGPGAGADETASRVLGNLNHLIEVLSWAKGGRA